MSKLPISGRRQWTSLFLSASGALVLTYVGYQYSSMYLAQHRLEREWQRRQNQPAIHAQARAVVAADSLMRLSAPRIGLDSIVVEGVGVDDLFRGPGHMEHTAFPGQIGNMVITGHRDTFFRRVSVLAPGDLLIVEQNGQRYTYQVTGKKVVAPTDLSVIQPSSDAELTLITCHPTLYLGPAPERLVVFSRLVHQTDTKELHAVDDRHDAPKAALKNAAGRH